MYSLALRTVALMDSLRAEILVYELGDMLADMMVLWMAAGMVHWWAALMVLLWADLLGSFE